MVKSGWHGNQIAAYQGDKQGGKHVFTGLCNDSVCFYWVFIQQTLNMDWLMLWMDSWSIHLMTLEELCVSSNWLCTWMDPALGKWRMDDAPPTHNVPVDVSADVVGGICFLRRRRQNPSLFLWWCSKEPMLYLRCVIPGWFRFLLLLWVFCFGFPSVNIPDAVVFSLTCFSSSGPSWAHLWGATSLFLIRSKLQFRALVCDLH